MTCGLCQGPVADLDEGEATCPHCGAVIVVVRIDKPAWVEALHEPQLEQEDA